MEKRVSFSLNIIKSDKLLAMLTKKKGNISWYSYLSGLKLGSRSIDTYISNSEHCSSKCFYINKSDVYLLENGWQGVGWLLLSTKSKARIQNMAKQEHLGLRASCLGRITDLTPGNLPHL